MTQKTSSGSDSTSARSTSFTAPVAESFLKIPFFQRRNSQHPIPGTSSNPTTVPNHSTFSYSINLNTSNPTIQRQKSSSSMSLVDSQDTTEFNLVEFVDNFKRNVPIKDRKWRTKTFRKVFVGSDAVQWMVTSGVAETREDAVKLGLMLQEAGLIEHTVRDHEYVLPLLISSFQFFFSANNFVLTNSCFVKLQFQRPRFILQIYRR